MPKNVLGFDRSQAAMPSPTHRALLLERESIPLERKRLRVLPPLRGCSIHQSLLFDARESLAAPAAPSPMGDGSPISSAREEEGAVGQPRPTLSAADCGSGFAPAASSSSGAAAETDDNSAESEFDHEDEKDEGDDAGLKVLMGLGAQGTNSEAVAGGVMSSLARQKDEAGRLGNGAGVGGWAAGGGGAGAAAGVGGGVQRTISAPLALFFEREENEWDASIDDIPQVPSLLLLSPAFTRALTF
jgi:hypothetical protein